MVYSSGNEEDRAIDAQGEGVHILESAPSLRIAVVAASAVAADEIWLAISERFNKKFSQVLQRVNGGAEAVVYRLDLGDIDDASVAGDYVARILRDATRTKIVVEPDYPNETMRTRASGTFAKFAEAGITLVPSAGTRETVRSDLSSQARAVVRALKPLLPGPARTAMDSAVAVDDARQSPLLASPPVLLIPADQKRLKAKKRAEKRSARRQKKDPLAVVGEPVVGDRPEGEVVPSRQLMGKGQKEKKDGRRHSSYRNRMLRLPLKHKSIRQPSQRALRPGNCGSAPPPHPARSP